MCIVKTPKVKTTDATAATPEPAIIRNPYLDGVDPTTRALRMGRSSLRIERAGSGAASAAPPATASPSSSSSPLLNIQPVLPKITPVQGGGGRRGAWYGNNVRTV
ncbi:hypothetical protein [Novosphingobium lindaniclasticum]|uniref:Uncharacterized protein n=1 Tax=Novosphingobium lindaniclasticum LE124 TaxID=1096930 RepID=T0IL96_9SPHN|nr:hypothetical protein [Novosphingobium lindaniclasticum]EQB10414.1 hypothetical protein L284_17125 [Novosphingobium lindaniclasticum LE124]